MGEGYWINSEGAFFKVDEHARWIQVEGNARTAGLDKEAIAEIQASPWDFNGLGRTAIIMAATSFGLIRFRDHRGYVTFEFQMPIQDAIRAFQPFMEFQLGPANFCRLNNLATGECRGALCSELLVSQGKEDEAMSI